MKLHRVKIKAYRRFEDETNIHLDGKLVALTGPNEAGKTSTLKAIHHFSHTGRIGAEEKTNFCSEETKIELSFFLEKDDLEEAELTEPTWFNYIKKEDGQFQYSLKPWAKRDLTKRKICLSALSKLSKSQKSKSALEQEGFDLEEEEIAKVISLLQDEGEIAQADLDAINSFASYLPRLQNHESVPQYLSSLKANLSELLEFEEEHDPSDTAYEVLKRRLPPILFFSSEDRNINLPYDIRLFNHAAPANRKSPSKPLMEIIKRSGLDLAQLIIAQAAGNTAGTTGILSAANDKLRELADGVWSQSDASLYFELDGPMLDLLVKNEKGFEPENRFTNLRDRSDGYRQFVALHVFTFLEGKDKPILLIDEVEQHLHYDAQADLIQHLHDEKRIGKVIYTTHSAGALPEDLGSGIRLIQWDTKDAKKSVAINKFWKDGDGTTFRPLLFGMGATTFAFFPTRKALLAEGPTELLLLPRLMKEACGADDLGFQVVHGLSNLDPEHIRVMGGDLSGVAYITDNDKSGRALKKELKTAKISENRIFSIRDVGSFTTLEDLIDPSIWKQAVNLHIQKYGKSEDALEEISSAPPKGRIKALPEPIQLDKISFAYNILDIIADNPDVKILSPRAKAGLKKLTAEIQSQLKIAIDSEDN